MKKFLLTGLTTLMFSASVISPAFAGEITTAGNNDIGIVINGEKQNYSVLPLIEKDTVLVPMRAIFEDLGASINWNGDTQTAEAIRSELKIQLKIGSNFAQKNNETIKLAVPAVIVEGNTLVPLRFVSEALGAEVNWDPLNRAALINTEPKAQEKTEQKADSGSKELSYEQALNMALKNSYNLKNAQADIDKAKEMREKAEEYVDYLPSGENNTADYLTVHQAFIGLSQADVAWEMAKKQLGVAEDKLGYNVLKAYQEILKKEQEKEFADLGLKKALKQAQIVNVKTMSGMASQFEQNQAQNSLKEEQKKAETAAKALTDARQKLNNLLGVSLDSAYELVDIPKINELDLNEEGLNVHLSRITTDSVVTWLAEQNVRLAQMNLDLFVYNDPTNPNPYEVVEINLDKAKYSAADTKKQLAESTRTLYYSIKELEDQYKILELNLAKAEDGLKVLRVRYDLGMATETELLDAEYQAAQLKNNLYSLAVQHEQLKTAFAMPWVLAPEGL